MKRMLIMHGPMNQGGAETFLMKIYRAIDKTKYQFDFYLMGGKGFYDSEILSLGGEIFYSSMKTQGFRQYKNSLKSFFKTHHYDYVFRALSNSLSSLDLYYAKKYGKANVLIARSANSDSKEKVFHRLFLPFAKHIPNKMIAPSTEAAIFMFGRGNVEKGKVKLLMNGVDTSLFNFTEQKRTKIRSVLNISQDEKLFIHIGRFDEAKNHFELADIFLEIYSLNDKAKLLCVGSGILKNDFIKKCNNLNILDKIIFLENRTDINELLMAADAMLLPSLYEGMPNVVIEAQSTGLPCLVSNSITKECNISNIVYFESLGNPKKWAAKANNIANYNLEKRIENVTRFPKEYRIEEVTKRFAHIVFESDKEE